MIGYLMGIFGCWILSDALYSLALYLGKESWREDDKQTWLKDHSVRVIRGGIGIALMIMGGLI